MTMVTIGSGKKPSPVRAPSQTSQKIDSEYAIVHSAKCIWKCLQNNDHFVQASMCDFGQLHPADTRRNGNVIITSKRRRDVFLT